MDNIGKLTIILNPGSGRAKRSEAEKVVSTAFEKHQLEVKVIHLERSVNLEEVVCATEQSGQKTIVAAGGDGTISSVADALLRTKSGLTLGLLPMGTLNHFSKDLKIPQDIEKATAVIVAGHEHLVDVGEINGRYFVNNSSVGVYPLVVLDREAQERQGLSKWHALLRASLRAFKKFETLDVEIQMKGQRSKRQTPLIFIGNNRYVIEGPSFGKRKRLDEGVLTVLVAEKSSPTHLIADAFVAFFGRVRNAEDLDIEHVNEITIDCRDHKLEVAMDGEVTEMSSPLRYCCVPKALKVIVPIYLHPN